MSEEKPVQLKATRNKRKKKRFINSRRRNLHHSLNNDKTDTEVRPLTQHSFSKIKDVAELRKSCGNQDERKL